MRIYILVFILMSISKGACSQIRITGRIIEDKTGSTIVGVNVSELENNNISISNEEGEFEIIVNRLPTTLIFSHISYEKIQVEIKNEDLLIIKLTAKTIKLAEIKVGNPALAIINGVINKAGSDSLNVHFHKAFYRRISSTNNSLTKLHEVYMNAAWKQNGVIEWQPSQVRYAQMEHQTSMPKNMIWSSFYNSSVVQKSLNHPINYLQANENYILKIEKYINAGQDEEIAVISCNPKTLKTTERRFKGEIYVFTKTDNLLKVSGKYYYGKVKSFVRTEKVEINFRVDKRGFSVFDNSYQEMDVHKKFSTKKNIDKMYLVFLDEIEVFEKQKTIYPAYMDNDTQVIKNQKYNSDFWNKKVVIKPTKEDKKLMEFFEENSKY